MQEDGYLVLYAPRDRPIWTSGTNGTPSASLSLQEHGNVVIYSEVSVRSGPPTAAVISSKLGRSRSQHPAILRPVTMTNSR